MSIIEQPTTSILSEEEAEAVQKEPFSWEAAYERARQRRVARGLPADLNIQEDEETRQESEKRRQAAREYLQELRQGDPEYHRMVLEYLMRVLDEDREGGRKLFS